MYNLNIYIYVQATRHAEFEAVDELLAAYGGDCQAADFPECAAQML